MTEPGSCGRLHALECRYTYSYIAIIARSQLIVSATLFIRAIRFVFIQDQRRPDRLKLRPKARTKNKN